MKAAAAPVTAAAIDCRIPAGRATALLTLPALFYIQGYRKIYPLVYINLKNFIYSVTRIE
jgi:hypothetical protein